MGKKKAGGAEKLSPVFAACDEDDLEELLSLLKSQPSVRDSRNRDGWTPLHQACYAGSEACARALLEAGAKSSLKDADGDSPAHYASAQGHVGCLRILLKAGADLESVDNDGESVLDVADGYGGSALGAACALFPHLTWRLSGPGRAPRCASSSRRLLRLRARRTGRAGRRLSRGRRRR